MKVIEYKRDNFIITNDKEKINLEQLSELFKQTYWAKNISRENMMKIIGNSLCFSLLHNEKQIGFARVVTDYCMFAYLADVIIDEKYRGKKLGQWLISTVTEYPDLKEIRRISLMTKDAQNFYRKFGFENTDEPDKYMEIFRGK